MISLCLRADIRLENINAFVRLRVAGREFVGELTGLQQSGRNVVSRYRVRCG